MFYRDCLRLFFLKSIKVRENEHEEPMKNDAMNIREHHFRFICEKLQMNKYISIDVKILLVYVHRHEYDSLHEMHT